MAVPRSEYPRPQFVRDDWQCLNGKWQFEIDSGNSGIERGLCTRDLKDSITVPFCPESELSGIGNTDFMNAVWYRREVTIPKDWAGRDTLLHINACDYDTTVWVNGQEVARHRGGWTPITCELKDVTEAGKKATIVIRARDDSKRPKAMGKQSFKYNNMGCHYTRTTGIWQTVWMEPVPATYLQRSRVTPDVANQCFIVEQPIRGNKAGMSLRLTLKDGKGVVAQKKVRADHDFASRAIIVVPEDRLRLWDISDPFLYDLELELVDASGKVVDAVKSYCGMRSVAIDGLAIRINGKSVFQRLVLDQGYYADGIMTAPSDEALKRDIQLSMEAGFNGARLHQKVFEERFLYYCDKMGYLVWGEFGDWGSMHQGYHDDHQKPGANYITQWLEAVERDYSHPSIIGWCPLNETYQSLSDNITVLDEVTRGMFLATKAFDVTRPVLDVSGYSHRVMETDVYDCHSYEQDPEKFRVQQSGLAEDKPFLNEFFVSGESKKMSTPYNKQPYFVSEFGGIWWNPDAKQGEDSWDYGDRPRTIEEFYARFEGLCKVLLDDPKMFGYCYTQLTDVFQEQNGVYRFDRSIKFDMDRIRKAQQQPAAIESLPPVKLAPTP